MLSRIYIKENLGFSSVELELQDGLSVFTGVSGSGKSVLFKAILSIFGLSEAVAKTAEADCEFKFDMDEIGIQNEEINLFKFSKEKSIRYFINSQSTSKKNLTQIASQHIKYLNAKGENEFENERILSLIDELVLKNDPKFAEILAEFRDKFREFCRVKRELDEIVCEEAKVDELREFAQFEIDKLEKISPKIGEFEEIMAIKKRLSKRDKMMQSWQKAQRVFDYEGAVVEALNISDIPSGFFEDAMNELRNAKEGLNLEELDDINIEQILDRIETLSALNHRYGSIEAAIETLAKKKEELVHYSQLSFEKSELQKKFSDLNESVKALCNSLSSARNMVLLKFVDMVNGYLDELYMSNISMTIKEKELDISGKDEAVIDINTTSLKNLSSGEINRLRLAFIAVSADLTNSGEGVIFLDEIDANLSGKEAMSIAEVLVKISKYYQIFAISHQPQLSSRATSHFLVEKSGDKSYVSKIEGNEKVTELARMISGENITEEAINFAKTLIKF